MAAEKRKFTRLRARLLASSAADSDDVEAALGLSWERRPGRQPMRSSSRALLPIALCLCALLPAGAFAGRTSTDKQTFDLTPLLADQDGVKTVERLIEPLMQNSNGRFKVVEQGGRTVILDGQTGRPVSKAEFRSLRSQFFRLDDVAAEPLKEEMVQSAISDARKGAAQLSGRSRGAEQAAQAKAAGDAPSEAGAEASASPRSPGSSAAEQTERQRHDAAEAVAKRRKAKIVEPRFDPDVPPGMCVATNPPICGPTPPDDTIRDSRLPEGVCLMSMPARCGPEPPDRTIIDPNVAPGMCVATNPPICGPRPSETSKAK